MIVLDTKTIRRIMKVLPYCLTKREWQIIEMRYGISPSTGSGQSGQSKKTLQQIGDMLGVSRERIRQIERKALRKLKHPARLKALTTFL